MNLLRLGILGITLLGLMVSGLATAADDEQQQKGFQKKGQFQGKGSASLLTPDAIEKLKLSSEQKERLTRIDEEYKEKHKVITEKMKDAFQSKDKDKIKDAIQTVKTDGDKLRGEYLTKVESFLTDDQKKTFAEVKNDRGRGGFAGRAGGGQVLSPNLQDQLKLTDEQKKKVEELQKEVEGKINSILTPEQRKHLEEIRKGGAEKRPPATS